MTNLHDLIDALRAGKVWEPTFKRTLKQAFPEQHSWILSSAMDAVCFDMGDVEGVPELNIIPELMRMPYLITWFEAQNRDGLLGMLACEVGDGVLNIAVLNKRLGLAWQLVCVVEVFSDDSGELLCKGLAMVSGNDEKNYSALKYARSAVNLMARFIMALNCVNTKGVEHPAPKLINQKRAAKGKQPLFSFWTLHLSAQAANDGPPLGGTHASPRLHLRRGHIRQYSPGKYTWVEACVVGNKQAGIVMKDYALNANA